MQAAFAVGMERRRKVVARRANDDMIMLTVEANLVRRAGGDRPMDKWLVIFICMRLHSWLSIDIIVTNEFVHDAQARGRTSSSRTHSMGSDGYR